MAKFIFAYVLMLILAYVFLMATIHQLLNN